MSAQWDRLEGFTSAPTIAEFYQMPTEGQQRSWASLYPAPREYEGRTDTCACGEIKLAKATLCFDCAQAERGQKIMERIWRAQRMKYHGGFCRWDGPY